MHFRVLFLFILIIAVFTNIGCNKFDSVKRGQVIAVCYGQNLYHEDISEIVPPGTSANDSIAIIKQFINNWIMQQIMLHQAEKNLSVSQKDFKEQVESYRNSLVIYAYESELIQQKLDTVITMAQIEEFYNNNQNDFQLHEDIVRVRYVKIPEIGQKPDLVKKVTKLLKSEDEDDVEKLYELCEQSMLNCYLEDETWIRFDDLLNEIPIKTDDREAFLSNRKYYETKDSLYMYQVNFLESKTKEGVSPLSFEVKNIRNLLLNRRKIELMDRMQQDLFQEALKNKEFTIY